MKLPSAASIHSDFSNPLKSLLDIESNNLIEQKDFFLWNMFIWSHMSIYIL